MVEVKGNRGQVGEAIYLFLAALPGVRRQQMYWKSLATPNVVEVYCKGKNLQDISILTNLDICETENIFGDTNMLCSEVKMNIVRHLWWK